jgi:hypothetical protein
MSTISKIEDDFKEALKHKDDLKISTLRLLKNAIHNLEIEKQHPLSQEEIWEVIRREIKQRKEAILEYQKGNRNDLAKKEQAEIEILSVYLPPQLNREEIERLIHKAITNTKASSLDDFGKVMKEVMPKLKSRVDGSKIAEMVRAKLQKGT